MTQLLKIGPVDFPVFDGIAINMMPFIIGQRVSVPERYDAYWPLIQACDIEESEYGAVGYLSIDEKIVENGHAHRRAGIHTDGHGSSAWGWGRGSIVSGEKARGLYMASTISHSCRAWDYAVEAPGDAGDCETLRQDLEQLPATYMEANTIYWMTDKCPHESLPLPQISQRQWFRVVTHAVDIWYAYHSTANVLGILPSAQIIYGDKFVM